MPCLGYASSPRIETNAGGSVAQMTTEKSTDPFAKDPFRIDPAELPKLYRVIQHFDAPKVKDVPGTVRSELDRIGVAAKIKPGQRIAITAGSRGVANIPAIIRSVASFVKDAGGSPVVLPTMGSHGGATAEGQREMLRGLGVSEETVGCPILATMEVVSVGKTEEHGVPVFLDKNAAESDGIIVVGRVKQHTDFDAPIESGLHKMMTIGLGKHKGAIDAHRRSITIGFPTIIPEIGQHVLKHSPTPILAGLAIVENSYDETAIIEAVKPEDFEVREKALLALAKQYIGKLPFDQIDVLLIDESGKDVSGNGMDTNVTNRVMSFGNSGPGKPKVTRLILRDLTEATHGNANGIGQADFILKRAADKIDWYPTYMNSITGVAPEYGRMPVVCQHDHHALSWALQTSGRFHPSELRIVWIRNTLAVSAMYVSEAMLADVKANERLEIAGEPVQMGFDETGHLPELLRHE